ncbi:unnamed protein product [Timema podura]|uniref:Uncharacterized protein n=1 Tax=Timema podura TaxID=61482 RepID=A0ABN7NYE5_TIMPD|nr:unnamed protein product [Timema podura]
MSPPDWVSDPSYRVIHSVIGHWVLPSELRSKGNLTAEEADEDVNSLETTTHKKWRALATIVDRIIGEWVKVGMGWGVEIEKNPTKRVCADGQWNVKVSNDQHDVAHYKLPNDGVKKEH